MSMDEQEAGTPYRAGAQALMDSGHLVGALVMAGMGQTADVTQHLLDSYETQIAELHAELGLIRQGIREAFDSPWMPQPAVVFGKLYPPREDVKAAAQERKHHA